MATTRSMLRGLSNQGVSALGSESLIWVTENIIDSSITNQTATDINQTLAVSAGHLVVFVGIQVLVKEGATAVVDVGDGTNDDAFYDSADLNTGTVPVRYSSAIPWTEGSGTLIVASGQNNALFGIPGGKLYTADDTIDVVYDNTGTKAKARYTALIANMDGQAITS